MDGQNSFIKASWRETLESGKISESDRNQASTINDIYNEFAERVSLNHLDRICKALNCDISDILEYIPDEP